ALSRGNAGARPRELAGQSGFDHARLGAAAANGTDARRHQVAGTADAAGAVEARAPQKEGSGPDQSGRSGARFERKQRPFTHFGRKFSAADGFVPIAPISFIL